MSWFQKICRNTGLMIHGITQPVKDDAQNKPTKKVVKHEVEEQQLEGNVTLRRTTIEELEYKSDGKKPDARKSEDRRQETEDPK